MDTKKMRACSPLLPEPGDKVVCECLDEIERLRDENKRLREALFAYANARNWSEDSAGMLRMWMEPDSSTPEAYNGFDTAVKALAPNKVYSSNVV